jgi:hypothetical protein
MIGRGIVTGGLIALGALCLIASAPALGAAHTYKYDGPIDLQPRPSPEGDGQGTPHVSFKVRFKGGQAKYVNFFREWGAYYFCPGSEFALYPTDVGTGQSRVGFYRVLKVKKGRFSGSYHDPEIDGRTITVSGRISGPHATGTVDVHDVLPDYGDPAIPHGQCDTGVLTWSASR